jgi:DinB superfamily
MTKDELCSALESGHTEIASFFSSLPTEVFFEGSAENWSPAHHVGHLSLTHSTVTRGYSMKEHLPVYNTPPRSYEQMRDMYLEALKSAPPTFLANNPFAVTIDPTLSQDNHLQTFVSNGKHLREAITLWSEAELDTKAMKHPFLGLFSAREMLYFIHYHDFHHLTGVQSRVTK